MTTLYYISAGQLVDQLGGLLAGRSLALWPTKETSLLIQSISLRRFQPAFTAHTHTSRECAATHSAADDRNATVAFAFGQLTQAGDNYPPLGLRALSFALAAWLPASGRSRPAGRRAGWSQIGSRQMDGIFGRVGC